MVRRRLRSAFERHGVGVHTGEHTRVRLSPAEWGRGVFFVVNDQEIPAILENARGIPGSTVLACGGHTVRTPEHLLAALVGLGIRDARIEVFGPEVPVLDGSALPWCEGALRVGLEDGPSAGVVEIDVPIEVEHSGGRASVSPARRCLVEVDVAFEAGPVGTWAWDLSEEVFLDEIAPARTFVLERDVERLRAAGLGRGASVENTVLYGPDGPLGETRFPDEAVRHKLLDLVGDLAFSPVWPLRAHIRVERGSHALHHALMEALGRLVRS